MAGHHNAIRYGGHPAWGRLDPDEWDTEWLHGPRAFAKQLQMLEVDMEHAARWVDTMLRLVDQHLPDEEFTAERMRLLREWEKSRHRAQKALHHRFNPLTRRKALVVRDVEQALLTKEGIAKLRAELEGLRAEVRSRLPDREEPAPPPEPPTGPKAPRKIRRALHSELANLDDNTREMVDGLMRPTDLTIEEATDDELRELWRKHWPGMSDDNIEWVLDQINGRGTDAGH